MPYKSHTIALPSDIFSLSLHPTGPLLAAGLLSGHVNVYTWPPPTDSPDQSEQVSQVVEEVGSDLGHRLKWRKRRYKGSCRSVAFSLDGEVLFSAGLNSVLKAASSTSGKVISKIHLPTLKDSTLDCPSTITPLSTQHLLVGTDSGRIHLYDIRESSLTEPAMTWENVHDDYVSSATALPTSGGGHSRQFVSTGASTLAYLDSRKPSKPVSQSEDQEDELLCSTYISGLRAKSGRGGEKVLAGNSSGIVALWNRGEWEDHHDRINVSKSLGESVDAICLLPQDFNVQDSEGVGGRYIAAGSSDGKIRIVKMGSKSCLATLQHSMTSEEVKAWRAAGKMLDTEELGEGDGVTELGVDFEGRIVSGGGSTIKVWYWRDAEGEEGGKDKKRERSDGDGTKSRSDSAEESDGEKPKKRKKKRKGGTGKAKSAGPVNFASFKGLD